MKKTKIVCSIGPASNEADVMEQMVLAGMNVARINFTHATIEERDKAITSVREVRKRTGKSVAILWDTKGPEFRSGMLENDSIELINGNTIRMVKEEVLGTTERFSVNHPEAIDSLSVGDFILLENAKMKLEVISKEEDGVTCKVIAGGTLGNRKSMSVPGVKLNIPYVSEADRKDIEYACANGGEYLALSFVSCKEDVLEIKEILKRKDKDKEGENGSIGTSATRASIIQNLIKRGYIKEEKDKVISTELGREYYNILPDEWKKADLTAKWWIIQEEIRDGKADQNKLLDSILLDIKKVIATKDVSKFKLKKNYKNEKTIVGHCPLCGKDIIESNKSFYCSGFKEGCKFSVWKTIAGKKISKTNIKQLLENGVTTEIKGFKAKSGKQFNAKLQIINGEIKFLF